MVDFFFLSSLFTGLVDHCVALKRRVAEKGDYWTGHFQKESKRGNAIPAWRDLGNKTNKLIIVPKDIQLGEETARNIKAVIPGPHCI